MKDLPRNKKTSLHVGYALLFIGAVLIVIAAIVGNNALWLFAAVMLVAAITQTVLGMVAIKRRG